MAGDSEKRFERAMDRLFSTKSSSSPPTPATSSAGASSPLQANKMISDWTKNLGSLVPATTRPPRAALSTSTVGPSSSQTLCRPWDRGDLLRRLATFKSLTWFGRPQVAGPVACARRGWVNVDVDLISCDACGARLSLVLPPSWSRGQVDSVAEAFGEQLNSGHKALCPWKGNACAENLALFPPTPLPALIGGYSDRCEALLQLSALPVISGSAVELLKVSRGSQIEQFLAQPPPAVTGLLYGSNQYYPAAEPGERSEIGSPDKFYTAQRLIALCGWEPRILPYTVDCEERSAQSAKNSRSVGPSEGNPSRKPRDPGPSVLLVSRTERVEQKQDTERSKISSVHKYDPASAVLDCSLCGASVGLWGFATIVRPPPLPEAVMPNLLDTPKNFVDTPMCGISAASAIDGCSEHKGRKKEKAEVYEEAGEATTTAIKLKPSTRVLDLSLTIAGGPPPTQLSSPAMIPPAFGPIPGIQPRFGQPERSEMGDWVASYESRGPRDHRRNHHSGSAIDTSRGRPVQADSAEATVLDVETDDNEVAKGAQSSKRKGRTESSAVNQLSHGATVTSAGANLMTAEGDIEVQGAHRSKRKRTQTVAQATGTPVFFSRQALREFPRSSSVNAIDTNYHHKQENSMESVENLRQESDVHETAVSGQINDLGDNGDGTETVVQAQKSGDRDVVSGRSVQAVEPGLSKSDEAGFDEGAETNIAVISNGTGYGGGVSVGMGGGSVGMGGSHEADIQGEVNGTDFSIHQTESAEGNAEFVAELAENLGMTGEFVPDRGLMGESVPEEVEKIGLQDVRGDSHEVLLSLCPANRLSLNKKNRRVAMREGESRGRGGNREKDDQVDGEGTVDTTKAVIVGGDVSQLGKEVVDAQMTSHDMEGNGCTTSTAIHGPARGLEDISIWEAEKGEFDPIRQHRHFCPWVNGQVAAAAQARNTTMPSSSLCGWQLTVDALHAQHVHGPIPAGLTESESTASMCKADPLISVRKMLGSSPSKHHNGSHKRGRV